MEPAQKCSRTAISINPHGSDHNVLTPNHNLAAFVSLTAQELVDKFSAVYPPASERVASSPYARVLWDIFERVERAPTEFLLKHKHRNSWGDLATTYYMENTEDDAKKFLNTLLKGDQ